MLVWIVYVFVVSCKRCSRCTWLYVCVYCVICKCERHKYFQFPALLFSSRNGTSAHNFRSVCMWNVCCWLTTAGPGTARQSLETRNQEHSEQTDKQQQLAATSRILHFTFHLYLLCKGLQLEFRAFHLESLDVW